MFKYLLILFTLLTSITASKHEQYPLSELDKSSYSPYAKNDVIQLQCIQRQIDNGEHKFDENGEIIYLPALKCMETNKPMEFKYSKNENLKCTVKFDDEVFHLFQLYLHKDAPFTCRFEVKPNSGIYIPIDLSFRGNVLESHFDIDPNLNMLFITNYDDEIVSGTAFSSSFNTTKVIIGQKVELNFNIKWMKIKQTLYDETNQLFVSWIPNDYSSYLCLIYSIAGFIVGIVLTVVISYKKIGKKVQSNSWTAKVE